MIQDTCDSSNTGYVNILLLGRCGSGKSSLINRLLKKPEAVINDVVPETDGIVIYDGSTYGLGFNLLDSAGYELDKGKAYIKCISKTIQVFQKSKPEIHLLIWYCIPIVSHRIEDIDIQVLKQLMSNEFLHGRVCVVFTKCDEDDTSSTTVTEYQKVLVERNIQIDSFETSNQPKLILGLERLLDWSAVHTSIGECQDTFIEYRKKQLNLQKQKIGSLAISAAFAAQMACIATPSQENQILTSTFESAGKKILDTYGILYEKATLYHLISTTILPHIPVRQNFNTYQADAEAASKTMRAFCFALSELTYKKIYEYLDDDFFVQWDTILDADLVEEMMQKGKQLDFKDIPEHEHQYARIMVIGKSGSGKSSFLNYIIGEEHFKVSDCKPCTQGFEPAIYESVDGIPLQVYDSKGLEVMTLDNIEEEILEFLRKRCRKQNPMNWIHSIFYCINIKNARIEDSELNLIREVQRSVSQTVHFILTHCDCPNDARADKMEQYIRECFSESEKKNFTFIRINSSETKTRMRTVSPFGREEALKTIFKLLWSDMAHKIAADYAHEYRRYLSEIIGKVEKAANEIKKAITLPLLIKALNEGTDNDIFSEKWDSIVDPYDLEMNELCKSMSEKYINIINPIVVFYNAYNRPFGRQFVVEEFDEISGVNGRLDSFGDEDLDNIFSRTKLGKKMSEFDDTNMNIETFGDLIKVIARFSSIAINIHSLFGEVIDAVVDEVKASLPTENQIEDAMYQHLMSHLIQQD